MLRCFFFFFFNDTATTEIYTLSLHDALPIYQRVALLGRRSDLPRVRAPLRDRLRRVPRPRREALPRGPRRHAARARRARDRKSTRLNSSHVRISYAVFCLKKKKNREAQSSLI